jgi:hypothetical protein
MNYVCTRTPDGAGGTTPSMTRGSHDNTNSMLLIIEHRGFGLANAPNPVLKVTKWTDSGAAISGSPARWATGNRRRCRPRFADPGCDLARLFAGQSTH